MFTDRISVLIKETSPCENTEQIRRQASPDTESVGTLILNSSVSRTMINKLLLFISYHL